MILRNSLEIGSSAPSPSHATFNVCFSRDASSAIPGFLQGLTGKSDMQLLSSGDEDATADKKRKRCVRTFFLVHIINLFRRAGSASDMPDFLQIKGKQTPNTSVRASSAFHDDTSVLHVKSVICIYYSSRLKGVCTDHCLLRAKLRPLNFKTKIVKIATSLYPT